MALGERKKKLTSWKKEITSLQFLGETNQILTSSGDNQVRIVGDDGAEVRSMTNLPEFMQSAAANSPTGTIVAGGEDSALRFWDASNGKELATLTPPQTQPTKKP
jgi:WD40 repeat protein